MKALIKMYTSNIKSIINNNVHQIYIKNYKGFCTFKTINYDTSPKNPHRVQKGLWHLKRRNSSYKTCFSEKKSKKMSNVNIFRPKLYSETLKTYFYIPCSSKALKTIRKYEGLDNYINLSSDKVINDSKFAQKFKELINNEIILNQSDIARKMNLKMLQVPYYRLPKNSSNTRKNQSKKIPSIYYPPFLRRTDVTLRSINPKNMISRVEQAKIDDINKELELNTDNDKRIELRNRLSKLLKEDNTFELEQHKYIEPFRHLQIRNEFIRLRNNFRARVKYIDQLKESENQVKLRTGSQYKHYSEDYPEVQLILQQTELQKHKKGNKTIAYKKFTRELGDFKPADTLENEEFDPFSGKVGGNNEPKL